MSSKKKKAELAIQYPEVRTWVLGYVRKSIARQGHSKPTDLFDTTPTIILEKAGAKEVNDWLNNTRHLYNVDGAIALMDALLDRLS